MMPLRSSVAETPLALLVVGLGGGSLPLFVHDHFPQSCVDAVEIDPSMLEVATQWFGFAQSSRMKVHIADGLDYITGLAGGEGTAVEGSEGCRGKNAPRFPGPRGPLDFISSRRRRRRRRLSPARLSPCLFGTYRVPATSCAQRGACGVAAGETDRVLPRRP